MSDDPGTARAAAITIEPDPARGFVRIRVRGKFSMSEAQQQQAVVASAHPDLHRLWDFIEADLGDWTAPEIRSGIDAIAERTPPARGAGLRVAGLVSRDLEYGVARMFESMAAGRLPMRYAVFRAEARAIEWLLTGE